MLDEHGGEKEKRHAKLCKKFADELDAAIQVIAAKPEYAEIISYTSFPEQDAAASANLANVIYVTL